MSPTEYEIRVRCVECGESAHADHIVSLSGRERAHEWPFIWLTETEAQYRARLDAWMTKHPRAVAKGYPYLDAEHADLRRKYPVSR